MYLIVKQGVYFQGICGLYESEIVVLEKALALIAKESDDYHDFKIYEIDVNEKTDITGISNQHLCVLLEREGKGITISRPLRTPK